MKNRTMTRHQSLLSRTNPRAWKCMPATFGAALGLVAGFGALSAFRPGPPDEVVAKRIRLVDEKGRVRAELSTLGENVLLEFRDLNGKRMLQLGAEHNASGMVFFRDGEVPAARVAVSKSGSTDIVAYSMNDVAFSISVDRKGTSILSGTMSRPHVFIESLEDGSRIWIGGGEKKGKSSLNVEDSEISLEVVSPE